LVGSTIICVQIATQNLLLCRMLTTEPFAGATHSKEEAETQ